jgi:predicted RNA methylase
LIDKNRTLKYRYAILSAIKPDDVVIDFGCGTGILGFFALQAGARHIYAIEETTIIEYAKKLAVANDFADRISFLHKSGKEVTEQDIPEKVDIILSEPISNLLVEGDLWSSLQYLKRFLKPNGVIVPESGTLFVVPVKDQRDSSSIQSDL